MSYNPPSAFSAAPLLSTVGDSILLNPASPNNVPAIFAAANPTWTVVNYNAAGEIASVTFTNYSLAQGAGPRYSKSRLVNVIVIETGSNDLQTVATTAAILASIDQTYQAALATGYFPIVCTIIPRGDLSGPNESRRQTVNAGIISAYSAAHICNPCVDTHFANQAAASNTTYYNADTVHLVAVGAALYNTYLQPQVLAVLTGGSSGVMGSMAGQDSKSVSIIGGTIGNALTTIVGSFKQLTVQTNDFGVSQNNQAILFAEPTTGTVHAAIVRSTNGSFPNFYIFTDADFIVHDMAGNDLFRFTASGNLVMFGGITGVTGTSSAGAGIVGEIVSSYIATGSAVSLTTATGANVTSISLTAGDWDVSGNINFNQTAATATAIVGGLSSTTGTVPTDGSEVYAGGIGTLLSSATGLALPTKRFSLSGTTTVYLVAKATFSAGTETAFGGIVARRRR